MVVGGVTAGERAYAAEAECGCCAAGTVNVRLGNVLVDVQGTDEKIAPTKRVENKNLSFVIILPRMCEWRDDFPSFHYGIGFFLHFGCVITATNRNQRSGMTI